MLDHTKMEQLKVKFLVFTKALFQLNIFYIFLLAVRNFRIREDYSLASALQEHESMLINIVLW